MDAKKVENRACIFSIKRDIVLGGGSVILHTLIYTFMEIWVRGVMQMGHLMFWGGGAVMLHTHILFHRDLGQRGHAKGPS